MGASSADAAKETINEFKSNPNKYVAAAKVAAKTVRRAVTSPTVFDLVLVEVFTLIPIGLATGLAIFIIGLSKGEVFDGGSQTSFFKSSNPSLITPGAQCFGSQTSFSEYTLNINIKTSASGLRPTTYYNDIGQTTEWIDTGLVTNGSPLEVKIDGEWFPWGRDNTKKINHFRQETSTDISVDNPIGSTTWYKNEPKNTPCKFTTDFTDSKAGGFESEKNYNHMLRYASSEKDHISIDNQIEYIFGVHCYDDKCQNRPEYDPLLTTSCSIKDGHGLYLKIGEQSEYAYHIANYQVAGLQTRPDPEDQTKEITELYSESGIVVPYRTPFTLPTKIYDKEYRANKPQNITRVDARLKVATQGDMSQVEMATKGTDCESYLNSADFYLFPNETCPPKKNDKLFLKISDIFYPSNEGSMTVSFISGAKAPEDSSTGGIQAPRNSVLQTLAFFFLEPIIGKQDITKYEPGTLVQISDRDSGAIIQARNAVLRNIWFQVIRILLLVIGITNLGRKVVLGEESLNLSNIMKKTLRIGIAIWGTHPDNYQLVDDVIVPFFYTGISSLFGYLFSAVANLGGLNVHLDNPFTCFDMVLTTLFSPVIGYKMLAAFRENHVFWLTSPILFCFILVLVNAAFKTFFTTLIAILSTFMLIFFFPLVFVMLLEEQTSSYAQKLINMMESNIVTTMLFLFLMSLIFAIALKFFNELFSFPVCWERIYSFNIFVVIKINVYGWKVTGILEEKEYVLSLLLFAFTTYLTTSADDIMSQLQDLIGGQGAYGRGVGLVNDFLGATQAAMPFVPKTIFDTAGAALGRNVTPASKISLTDMALSQGKKLIPSFGKKGQDGKGTGLVRRSGTNSQTPTAMAPRGGAASRTGSGALAGSGAKTPIQRMGVKRPLGATPGAAMSGGRAGFTTDKDGNFVRSFSRARDGITTTGEEKIYPGQGYSSSSTSTSGPGGKATSYISRTSGGGISTSTSYVSGGGGVSTGTSYVSGGGVGGIKPETSGAIDFRPVAMLNDAAVQRVGIENLQNLRQVFDKMNEELKKSDKKEGMFTFVQRSSTLKDYSEAIKPKEAEEKALRRDSIKASITGPMSIGIEPEKKPDVKIGNVDMNLEGVTASVDGVTTAIDAKIDTPKSELAKNMTEEVNQQLTKEQKGPETTKSEPEIAAMEIKKRKTKDFLKTKIEESKNTIEELEKMKPQSKGFTENVKNLIATASELQELAKKNGVNIDLTSNLMQSSKASAKEQEKSFSNAQSQAQILSFILQKKINKK